MLVKNSTNINKTNNHLSPKESLKSDGQQFHQYQQYKQSPLTSNHIVSLNPAYGEVYSMQHYAIKFVSYLRQVSGFLWVLWFPPTIPPSIRIILELFIKLDRKYFTLIPSMNIFLFLLHQVYRSCSAF